MASHDPRRLRRDARSNARERARWADGAARSGELGAQDFDGHIAIVFDVACEVDRRHAARAEFALDAVAVGQGVGEGLHGGGHARKLR